jgi:Uma2 family endonuclease
VRQVSEPSLGSFDLEEFLAWEDRQTVRHEFVGGRAYAMLGESYRSNLLKEALAELLGPRARAKGCRLYVSDARLVTPSGHVYYPDLMVCCGGPPTHEHRYEDDAALVVEVLSPSTRSIDRREKVEEYGKLASVELYLLFEPDFRLAQAVQWHEGVPRWEEVGPGGSVATTFGPISLDDLYDLVDEQLGG